MLEISSQAEANASASVDGEFSANLVEIEPQSHQPRPEDDIVPIGIENPFTQQEEVRPGPSRLMRSIEPIEDSSSNSTTTPEVPGNSSTTAATERTAPAAGLGSIEALAQNILEMQNLCRYDTNCHID